MAHYFIETNLYVTSRGWIRFFFTRVALWGRQFMSYDTYELVKPVKWGLITGMYVLYMIVLGNNMEN